MKLIRKIRVIVFVSLVHLPFVSTAQFTIGVDAGFVKHANFESYLGAGISSKYFVSDDLRVGINAGFYQAPSFEISSPDPQQNRIVSSRIIPVSITTEYLFLKNRFRPYLGAHVGLLQLNNSVDKMLFPQSCLNLAPVLGVEYQITQRLGINANVKYNLAFYKDDFRNEIERFSTVNANVGVFYKL